MLSTDAQPTDLPEKVKILCVDDEASVLKALRRLFEGAGYEVLSYASAHGALKVLEAEEVDVIISDMRMPDLSGDQFLAQAAYISPTSIRILLTGFSDIESTIKAINEGKIHAYLQKPWDNQKLLGVIATELGHRQQASDRVNLDRTVKSLQTIESHNETALATLIYLAKRTRVSTSDAEQRFILANETVNLVPYRQAVYWEYGRGVVTISGVTSVEKHSPYVQWLDKWFRAGKHHKQTVSAITVDLNSLGKADSAWREWLHAQVVTLDINAQGRYPGGRLLIAREEAFDPDEVSILIEWLETWRDHYQQNFRLRWWKKLGLGYSSARKRFFTRTVLVAAIAVAAIYPVHLTVLAPAELIPLNPSVVRAPMDAVVDRLLVEPNQRVTEGEALLQFDRVALESRLEVARRALVTAETEYRQQAQKALFDSESKARLSVLQSQIKQREIEVAYLQELTSRSEVLSPRAGLAIFFDPSEWEGRPVITGERIMVLADEQSMQIEAWLSPADMIDLSEGASARLFLSADPTRPIEGKLTYLSYHPELRPDGLYAYRVRAELDQPSELPRIGLKGTVRVEGAEVSLIYWVLRRPWAAVRGWMGL